MSLWQACLREMKKVSDPKVFVFYGPSSELANHFEIGEPSSYLTLLQFVVRLDASRTIGNRSPLEFEEKKLVVWPEEFFGVKDNFVHSFWRNILETGLESVYFSNPPDILLRQAKIQNLHIEEKRFDYTQVDTGVIKSTLNELNASIIGQGHSIRSLARSLTSLINSHKKPIVVMLYGPTGVGKTESAKIVSNSLGGEATRLQFSMLQTGSLADYLYGSRISNRSFASDLLERRSNVIIFDEFDKTSSVFHSAFYQFFDEGIFVDKNYKVDVANTLVVCTSNYDSEKAIKEHLGDALSSRFSAFIKFSSLDTQDKKTIASQKIDSIYDSYPSDVRSLIDVDFIKQNLINKLSEAANVREISNYVEYIMSDYILKAIDQSNSSSEDSDGSAL